eukprot:GHUV01046571.1.p1 GENE.GHUV01046571.1~~GHUV01046571.1.p1  ORF type:complete len:147 (-),score=31.97 GHUV01046571.1:219-659(-)
MQPSKAGLGLHCLATHSAVFTGFLTGILARPEDLPAAPGGLNITAPAAATTPGSALSSATTPNPRASMLKPFQGTVASLPEAAGLPYDEGYAYLCLLRRYILYGPTLGLATAPVAGTRQPNMSMTGAALAASIAGGLSSGNSQTNL